MSTPFHKRAEKAARRGDIREADRAEFDYITAFVKLYSPVRDRVISARCSRLCRGAGEHGETLIEWVSPAAGGFVYSDIDGNLLPQYEDEVSFSASFPASMLSEPACEQAV